MAALSLVLSPFSAVTKGYVLAVLSIATTCAVQ
jgi:hypothetical protein